MAKKRLRLETSGARFEYRVWGDHRRARKRLVAFADDQLFEQVDDCYLRVDDPSWNAKIRRNTLEVKQLVAERRGFEQWTSDRHHTADTVPTPFVLIFEQLGLDRAGRASEYDLPMEMAALGPNAGVRAVFVTKQRRRYRVGGLRAESSDITIQEIGETLHTLSIEGDDLGELAALRKRLGLRGEQNIAVHNALDLELAA